MDLHLGLILWYSGDSEPVHYRDWKKYSDMLNMKALAGIRIIFMGKDFEW